MSQGCGSYMILISKCREDRDLGLCTTSGLAFGEPQRNDKFRFFLRRNTFFSRKSPLRCGSPNVSPEVVHSPRSQSPLTFWYWEHIANSPGKIISYRLAFAFRSVLERWPHICRVKITFTKLPTNRFVSKTKNTMKCVVNWIPLRICVRSRNTQPHLTPVAGLNLLPEKVSDSSNFS